MSQFQNITKDSQWRKKQWIPRFSGMTLTDFYNWLCIVMFCLFSFPMQQTFSFDPLFFFNDDQRDVIRRRSASRKFVQHVQDTVFQCPAAGKSLFFQKIQ